MRSLAKYVTAILAAGLMLAACAQLGFPAPQTPAQTVYVAKADFLAALTVANQYKSLPPCGQGDPICSDQSVVTKLQLAAIAAKATLDAAEATVRDPGFDGSKADAGIVAAQNAITAFITITKALKVQP